MLERAVTKIVGYAEVQRARIIGIVGHSQSSDSAMLATEVTAGYLRFGRPVTLVDATGVAFDPAGPSDASGPSLDLDALPRIDRGAVQAIDLAAAPGIGQFARNRIRTAFLAAVDAGHSLVVDLPPAMSTTDLVQSAFVRVGAACDVVFLVCLTGAIKSSELGLCLEKAKIGGVKLGGLILNDKLLPASSRLAEIEIRTVEGKPH